MTALPYNPECLMDQDYPGDSINSFICGIYCTDQMTWQEMRNLRR